MSLGSRRFFFFSGAVEEVGVASVVVSVTSRWDGRRKVI